MQKRLLMLLASFFLIAGEALAQTMISGTVHLPMTESLW